MPAASTSRIVVVLPASEPASNVSAIQRRCSLPWRTMTAGWVGTTAVVGIVVRVVARVVLGGAIVVDVISVVEVGIVADVDDGGVAARFVVPQQAMVTTTATSKSDPLRGAAPLRDRVIVTASSSLRARQLAQRQTARDKKSIVDAQSRLPARPREPRCVHPRVGTTEPTNSRACMALAGWPIPHSGLRCIAPRGSRQLQHDDAPAG